MWNYQKKEEPQVKPIGWSQTYKLRFEPLILSNKFINPRKYVTASVFKKIKAKRTSEIGGHWCESCGDYPEPKQPLELHESYRFHNNICTFEGFFLLCETCHSAIHDNSNIISGPTFLPALKKYAEHGYSEFENGGQGQCEFFIKRGIFKNSKEALMALHESLSSAIRFNLCENPIVDYSVAEKYGLDKNKLLEGFNAKFPHKYSKIDLLIWIYKSPLREKINEYMEFEKKSKTYTWGDEHESIFLHPFNKKDIYFDFFYSIRNQDLNKYKEMKLSDSDSFSYGTHAGLAVTAFNHFGVRKPDYVEGEALVKARIKRDKDMDRMINNSLKRNGITQEQINNHNKNNQGALSLFD